MNGPFPFSGLIGRRGHHLLVRAAGRLMIAFTAIGLAGCGWAIWKYNQAQSALEAEVLMAVPGAAFFLLLLSIVLVTMFIFARRGLHRWERVVWLTAVGLNVTFIAGFLVWDLFL